MIKPLDKWTALVRYDTEIAAAAEKLRPYGEVWVEELGRAYFALNEDRRYLANMLAKLLLEAEADAADKARSLAKADQERDARQWASKFSKTYESELLSDVSIEILRRAEKNGYVLIVQDNSTIAANKNSTVVYLRSNSEIERFSKFMS